MIVRTAILAVYLVVLVGLFALQLVVPALAIYVFYGLLFWLFASFFVFRLPGMSRPIPGTGAARGPSPPGSATPPPVAGAPLPSTGAPVALGFCAFCGTDLPVGTATCPSCGHAVRAF